MTDLPNRIYIESDADETAEGYESWDSRQVYKYDTPYIHADVVSDMVAAGIQTFEAWEETQE